MGRKENDEEIRPINPAEENVSSLEARRLIAESAVIIAGNDKKRVEGEVKSLEVKCLELENNRRSIEIAIELLHSKKKTAENLLEQFLQTTKTTKTSLEKDLQKLRDDIVVANKEKSVVSTNIMQMQQKQVQLQNDLNSLALLFKNLQADKLSIDEAIKTAEGNLVKIQETIKETEVQRDKAVEACANATKVLTDLQADVDAKKAELIQQNEALIVMRGTIAAEEQKLVQIKQSTVAEELKLQKAIEEADERSRIAAVAEKRVCEKVEYLNRIIEKAQASKLIDGFKI